MEVTYNPEINIYIFMKDKPGFFDDSFNSNTLIGIIAKKLESVDGVNVVIEGDLDSDRCAELEITFNDSKYVLRRQGDAVCPKATDGSLYGVWVTLEVKEEYMDSVDDYIDSIDDITKLASMIPPKADDILASKGTSEPKK